MGGYRVVELHPSDESLSRWFCLVCKEEVPQSGTMAPTCPARLAHEAHPQHLAATARKSAVAHPQRPQNLLQQRVDAPLAPAPGMDPQPRAAKRPKLMDHETVGTLRAAADVLGMWLPAAQLSGACDKQGLVAGQSLLFCIVIYSTPEPDAGLSAWMRLCSC